MPTTDSQQELLTEVDSHNQVIGPLERGIAHSDPSRYYRTIFVIVINQKGEILLQKRSATKDLYPNRWDLSVGGHVIFGDSYLVTAVRELEEEIGIKVSEKDLAFKGEVLVTLPESHEYFYVYEYKLKPADSIKLDKNEVGSISWMTIDEIKKSMSNEPGKWYGRPTQTIQALY